MLLGKSFISLINDNYLTGTDPGSFKTFNQLNVKGNNKIIQKSLNI